MRLALVVLFVLVPAVAAAQPAATGEIRGAIRDDASEPVIGATVVVSRPGLERSLAELSDDNGFYAVMGLVPGTYTVTVYAGASQVVVEVIVPPGETATANVRMDPEPVTELHLTSGYSYERRDLDVCVLPVPWREFGAALQKTLEKAAEPPRYVAEGLGRPSPVYQPRFVTMIDLHSTALVTRILSGRRTHRTSR